MELVIKEIKPLICLNMIVKDESHIIVDTLTKFLNKVSIDYWVISDTGSTDNTQEIIKTFFKKRDIPGELYEDKWENFAHNRTLALEHAHGKSDYIFVFDADDELCGDFQLPTLTEDAYHIQFGDANGTSYTRVLLVNNNTKKWRYLSVIHEFIDCVDNTHTSGVITGNYYCVSGRSGNRSKDPDKYLKDALVLEKAHAEALAKNDLLYFRYAFYCANSYFDYGKYMDAIKWYKITLGQGNWEQEKYVSCMKLFICYTILKQPEAGMFYLVKGILYDKTRVEGLFELVQYYCGNDMNELAYMYYEMVKEFYEKEYVKIEHTQDKLFVDISKANFHLPYWMIIVADRIKKYDTGIAMYRIIFTKKFKETNKMLIGNMLFNLQFFIDKVDKNDTQFFTLFKEYIDFLLSIQYPVFDHDFMINYEKYGIVVPKKAIHQPTFTKEECATSNKILIYTGFMNVLWNDSYVSTQSIGGAEKAVTYLSRYFPKNYEIIISGDVADEVIGNITYINRNKLQDLLEKEKFHTIVVSRYVSFFLLYRNFSCYQLFLSAHDSTGFINHVDNNILSVDSVILNWNYLIDGVITLTNWHKDNVIAAHPYLKDKMHIVNNGILTHTFPSCKNKIKNKFVWTSCSYRGLYVILHLWKDILENIPDATLDISSYNAFPENEDDVKMLEIMNKYNSIKHHGMLNTTQLYDLISKAEYWLYTNTFPETSCITGLEMLMSEVICLYYPLAGLLDTVGNYGIQVNFGNEINTILNLSEGQKIAMRKRGREYALSCSWENRAKEWCDVLFVENNTIKNRIYELHNIGSIPKNHVDFLKNLAIDFKPKVIYDIGANVLTWTREAHKIWSDSEIIAFDAIQTAEFFYKEQNLKYHIGVLSKEDNSVVKFYENIEHPAGNSYYKEIGHKISNELYPENAFTEQSTISLSSVVKNKNFPLPDLVKIDVQGSELDILRGGMNVINNAKYLIVELQDVQYNRGAPLADETIQFLNDNSWDLIARKFCDNGPDGDYCFLNKNYDHIKEPNPEIKQFLTNLYNNYSIPQDHINYLKKMNINFNPIVIYDIGAAVLHWTKEARKFWPNSEIIVFDAMKDCDFLYQEYNLKYNIGILSDIDNRLVNFYGNIYTLGGNSYYKEIGHRLSNELYPENAFTEQSTISLSSVVKNKNFPLPDLVKIDVQGSELDILRGGMNVINNAKYLIVELQDVQYNRGAPLADETIQFLYDNGWELIDKKFSDNGPDADYCFLNKNYKMNDAVDVVINKPKLVFFVNRSFILQPLIDYFDSLKEKYDITHTQNIDDLNEVTDALILFVIGNLNIDIGNYLNKNDNTIGLFNTEPLNIQCWLSQCIHLHMLYPTIKMYDYSNSNICILKNNNIIDVEYLPYLKTISENKYLTKIYSETPKIYDFGIISPKKTMPITPPRRNKILEYLINNGFTLNLITGWKEVRDNELAKCKFILNIHGQINENPDPTTDETSNIFEHIRCDRLLEAGFQILSEESLYLDPEFINKYPNLKLINYEDFFNLETYNVNDNGHEHFNFINNNILKNIYETLCSNKSPFNDIYVNPEDIYEHLPTLYKYANECESILECGVRGVVSSWAFLYGLMNNNKENKKIILNDITECNIQKILEYNNVGVTIEYKWINDLHLKLDDNVDLTFIDTWHVYGQLKRELDHFSKVTNKYIIMHDTTIDEYTSEAIRANLSDDQIYQQSLQSGFAIEEIKKGLWPAIEEFLENNTDWSLHERFKNNNGLTILKKQTPSIVVGSLQLLRLAPTEFNHSPSTSSTARSSM